MSHPLRFGSLLPLLATLPLAIVTPQTHASAVAGLGNWETTLQGRDLDGNVEDGYEAYYDSALNITWLANANYAGTGMDWGTAKDWADKLSINGVTGWRLPKMLPAAGSCLSGDGGTGCGYFADPSSSELAHMFYATLGNSGYYNPNDMSPHHYHWIGRPLDNTGPFQNIQSEEYWMETPGFYPRTAWNLFMSDGFQGIGEITPTVYAWAVHDGDIGTAWPIQNAVPEPGSFWLALEGIAALVFGARRSPIKRLG
ncbi:MAG: hypothetical protein QM749_04450 [Aquabacterium sp.]